MSEENIKNVFQKEYSRRQFLVMSGKGIASVGITATMLSLFGCTVAEVENGNIEVMAYPEGMLVINSSRCSACQRCELTCSLVNHGKSSPYISAVKVRDKLYFDGTDTQSGKGLIGGNFNFHPETCRQCKDAPCMAACPAGAIAPDPKTNARVVDAAKCIGCGACTTACPWHLPTVDPETKKSFKCTACGACAGACVTGALKLVKWSEIESAAKS